MKILLVHEHFPGPFTPLLNHLRTLPDVQIHAIGGPGSAAPKGVGLLRFNAPRAPSEDMHWYLRSTERAVLIGQAVAGSAITLRKNTIIPDVILAHGDSGSALYLKDIFREVPLVVLVEASERAETDPRFAFGEALDINHSARMRAGNINTLISLEACDFAITPSLWTYSRLPVALRPRARVLPMFLDTALFRPDPAATVTLPGGRVLSRRDRVVTVMADRLDPRAGLPTVLPAFALLQATYPDLMLVLAGADVPAGNGSPAPTLRESLIKTLGIDPARVAALPMPGGPDKARLLQVSSVHVHLNPPRVLDTTLLEALACGCAVVASGTQPMREVVLDGVNGILVDFFDRNGLADRIAAVITHPTGMDAMRDAARATVVSRFDPATCVAQWAALLTQAAATSRG